VAAVLSTAAADALNRSHQLKREHCNVVREETAVVTMCQPPNKQLERTAIRQRVRAACAPFHYAHAARFTRQRAAAQLRG
jgi:hypothetical protein